MTPGFPLAGLLRLRRLQEEQAAAELARAHAARRAAQLRREATEDLLAGTAMPHRGSEMDWRAAVAARAALTGLVGEATLATRALDDGVGDAHRAWSAARTVTTTLDKLAERHEAAARAEAERLEQLVLDEAAARLVRSFSTSAAGDRPAADRPQPRQPGVDQPSEENQ